MPIVQISRHHIFDTAKLIKKLLINSKYLIKMVLPTIFVIIEFVQNKIRITLACNLSKSIPPI